MRPMKGVRINTQVHSDTRNLATKKDVEHNTFWCLLLGPCNQAIVVNPIESLWNIIPNTFEGIWCYRMEKASGYMSNLSIAPSSSVDQAVNMDSFEGRANCR